MRSTIHALTRSQEYIQGHRLSQKATDKRSTKNDSGAGGQEMIWKEKANRNPGRWREGGKAKEGEKKGQQNKDTTSGHPE